MRAASPNPGRKAKSGTREKATPSRRPTELQQLQKQLSHRKLLDATYAAIAELSYAETTVDDIVKRASVNRSTFYRHFDSKFAAARGIFERFWPLLFEVYDRLGGGADPSEAEIEAWIDELIAFYRANKPLYRALGQIPSLEPEGAEWEEKMRGELLSRLGTRIPAFRRAAAPLTPEERVQVRMFMLQFEHGVFDLAFKELGQDRAALKRFTVSLFRDFVRKGAEAKAA